MWRRRPWVRGHSNWHKVDGLISKRIAANLDEVLDFIELYKSENVDAGKNVVQAAVRENFEYVHDRSLCVLPHLAIRFAEANAGTFSNTVVSLSKIHQFDHIPVVVVVVRPRSVEFLLANSTFIRKISHSSQKLAIDKVRGSFNGSDIIRQVNGIANERQNFASLFALHREKPWSENLARIVKATAVIAPRGVRFAPTLDEIERILASPGFSSKVLSDVAYRDTAQALYQMVKERSGEILTAAGSENVNLRGNGIEQILTAEVNAHALGDMHYEFRNFNLTVDIKTKLLNRSSAPKLYNVDKMLRLLSSGRSVFSLLLIAIDVQRRIVIPRLVSVLDRRIIQATKVQFHWAGRASLGVTQLAGDLTPLLADDFVDDIDIESAKEMLLRFLALGKA